MQITQKLGVTNPFSMPQADSYEIIVWKFNKNNNPIPKQNDLSVCSLRKDAFWMSPLAWIGTPQPGDTGPFTGGANVCSFSDLESQTKG